MLSAIKKISEVGIRASRQLHLFPKTDTDLPMVVHVFRQGESDLPHGVRTKSNDIHGNVAKGPMSDTYYKEKTAEIFHKGQITDKDAKLVAAWHMHNLTPLTAYYNRQLTEQQLKEQLQQLRELQPKILQRSGKKLRGGGRRKKSTRISRARKYRSNSLKVKRAAARLKRGPYRQ